MGIDGIFAPVTGDDQYGLLTAPFDESLQVLDDHAHDGSTSGNAVKRVASVALDNSTLELNSDRIRLKALGISTAKFANQGVTQTKFTAAPVSISVNPNPPALQQGTSSFQDLATIYGGSKTVTLSGRPVLVFIDLRALSATALAQYDISIVRGTSTQIRLYRGASTSANPTSFQVRDCFLDPGGTGSITYKIQIKGASFKFGHDFKLSNANLNPCYYEIFTGDGSSSFTTDALQLIEL